MKKKLVEGPYGIKMPEDTAKAVDLILKSLPKECTYRKKGTIPNSVEFVEGEKADISIISAETIDRELEVVVAKGIDKKYFDANPVVLFAHSYTELPVGRCAWVKPVPGGLKGKTIYSENTELARSCWAMTKEGILKGKSIGFLPTKIRSPTKAEVQWKDASAIIETSILLEYSVAPIPMNSDCLVEACAKGMLDKDLAKRLGVVMPKIKKQLAKPIDEKALLLKALALINVDPVKIAKQVEYNLRNRGKV